MTASYTHLFQARERDPTCLSTPKAAPSSRVGARRVRRGCQASGRDTTRTGAAVPQFCHRSKQRLKCKTTRLPRPERVRGQWEPGGSLCVRISGGTHGGRIDPNTLCRHPLQTWHLTPAAAREGRCVSGWLLQGSPARCGRGTDHGPPLVRSLTQLEAQTSRCRTEF